MSSNLPYENILHFQLLEFYIPKPDGHEDDVKSTYMKFRQHDDSSRCMLEIPFHLTNSLHTLMRKLSYI